MTIRGGWGAVRESVRQKLGSSAYEAWIAPVSGRVEGDRLVLLCPDRFSRDWIRSRYDPVIREVASDVRGVEYRVDSSATAGAAGRDRRREQPAGRFRPVVPEPTFDTFVSGPSNALALEAARAVARGETGHCTPLVISGASGLGKTHLCRSIRAAVPDGSLYRSAEEFTSEVTGAMRSGRMDSVRHRYRRSLNVLILEDVQFLAGKRATQVELFHTLDHLVSSGRCVVLSADLLPHEIDGLDDRLRSRIASGLVAQIGPPELETRRQILREKAAAGGVRIPEDCLEMLAARSVASARDLLAGLNQVVARASLLRAPVDAALVHEALSAVEGVDGSLSLDEVIRAVCTAYGVTLHELASPSRRRRIVRCRQLAMYLARRYTPSTLHEIGQACHRDHTSVRYAIDVVERRILEQPQLRYEVEALSSRFSRIGPDRNGGGRTRGTRRS